jgi:hypothetical protein
VRYALTIVNAHHVSQAFMLSICAHHAPHCTAQAQRVEAAAYATLARFSLTVYKFFKRGLGRKEAAAYATLPRLSTRIT